MSSDRSKHLSPDQIDRLWQHKENVNTNFNNFVNFFLISESILLAVVGMLAGRPIIIKAVQISIIILGLILTLVWIYIQGK